MNRGSRRQAGFTLIETLVAMVIMTFTIVAVSNTWSGNVFRVQKARLNATTAALLQRKMTEFEILYKDKPLEVPEEESGDFGKDYPGFRWEMKSQVFEMPDLSGAMVAKEGGADEMLLTIIRTVSDYIKQSAKEVTVTVIYKGRAKNELRNSVTTYFVDYTKEVPLPGGGMAGALGGAQGGGGGAQGGGGGAQGGNGGGSGGGGSGGSGGGGSQ